MLAAFIAFVVSLTGAIYAFGQLPQWHGRWWFVPSLVAAVLAPTVGAWALSRGDTQAHAELIAKADTSVAEQLRQGEEQRRQGGDLQHLIELFSKDRGLEARVKAAYPFGYAILGLESGIPQWMPAARHPSGTQSSFTLDPLHSRLSVDRATNKLRIQFVFNWTMLRPNGNRFEMRDMEVENDIDLRLGGILIEQFIATEDVSMYFEVIDPNPDRPLVVVGLRDRNAPDASKSTATSQ